MSEIDREFSKLGFMKTFVLPSLSIFLVPAVTYVFFIVAQIEFDDDVRESILADISADSSLGVEERLELRILYSNFQFSELLLNEEFAAQTDPTLVFYFATFRWMIRLSAICIVSGLIFLVAGGIVIWVSSFSPTMQFYSLYFGWNLLRIYAALQTVAQATMLVALSFWVTALFLNIYIMKLIIVVGLVALAAVGTVISSIFLRAKIDDFRVEGDVLSRDSSRKLWQELERVCNLVGPELPDQVIAGIDDNFFVTEMPVVVDGKVLRGRTLYVSLALLKQLQGDEADAVLAHEMAHFSGRDTQFSKKTAPLLLRFDGYLHELSQSLVSAPAFFFMLYFRSLFELSLRKVGRSREFRADRVASEVISKQAFAKSLLRICAYSEYRASIEKELFDCREVMESASISEKLEQGFPAFAKNYLTDGKIASVQTTHPFDTHPPLSQRLDALGVQLSVASNENWLATQGDGDWFNRIESSEELEARQWSELESRFRDYHEESLPYRLLPATADERAIVEETFPERRFEGTEGVLELDCEYVNFSSWGQPLHFSHLASLTIYEDGRLQLTYDRDEDISSEWLPLDGFGNQKQELLEEVGRYHHRFMQASEYNQQIAS